MLNISLSSGSVGLALCILLSGAECSAVCCWRSYRFLRCIAASLLARITPTLCFSCPAQASKQNKYKEQENAYRYGGICNIEDVKIKANLGNTEEDEIDHVSTMLCSVNEVSRCAPNDQTKDELVCQWSRIEHTQVEVGDQANGTYDEYGEYYSVCEQAERCPTIPNIVKRQVLTNYRNDAPAICWA